MTGRDITQYWRIGVAKAEIAAKPARFHSAGSVLRKARPGDKLWIVTSDNGRLCLVQHFIISQVGLSRAKAAKLMNVKAEDLWDDDYHVIGSGSPIWPNHLIDIHDLATDLRFVSKAPHLVIKNNMLDPQTLRTLRVLEPASATLLMHRWERSVASEPGPESDEAELDVELEDMRKKVQRQIVARQGQGQFRLEILRAYHGKCCVTGYDFVDALDAAHIIPYMGKHSNAVENGLLLRSDLHVLFDRGHIAIDSSSMRIVIAPSLLNTEYAKFDGRAIQLPKDKRDHPSADALEGHRIKFGIKLRSGSPLVPPIPRHLKI